MTDVFIEVEKVENVEIVLSAVTGALSADGIVENTNSSYTDTVANGSTLVLPDINITKQDGSVITEPSVKDLDLRIIDPRVSRQAEAIFTLMPNPLTDEEKTKIETLVDLMVDSGNWAKTDYLFNRAMDDSTNALTSWKGVKTGVNVNGCSHAANKGYLANGSTQYIDNNINMSTDLTNATLNNIYAESYCYENFSAGSLLSLFGAVDNVGSIKRFNILQGTPMYYAVNAVNNDPYGGGSFLSKTRYGIQREDASNHRMYIDGVLVANSGDVSTGLPPHNIYSLANNSVGTVANHINARESFFIIGGGFDLIALKTELELLETLFII